MKELECEFFIYDMLVKEKLYKKNIKFKRIILNPSNEATICEQNNCPHRINLTSGGRVVEGYNYENPISKVCDYLLKRSKLINPPATPRMFYYVPDLQC